MAELEKQYPQYDVPLEQQALMLKKWQKRTLNRQQFQQKMYDPVYRNKNPLMYDEAFDRYGAMFRCQHEHSRYTRNSKIATCMFIGFASLLSYLTYTDHQARLHKYRTGQVAYKNRENRLIV